MPPVFFTHVNMELYYDLQVAAAWKPIVKKVGLWKSIRSLARLYDAGMGMLIFIPVAFSSWFPFVSTFQTRLMFNQAFSRGLEISLILAGNNPNTELWWPPLILYIYYSCKRGGILSQSSLSIFFDLANPNLHVFGIACVEAFE